MKSSLQKLLFPLLALALSGCGGSNEPSMPTLPTAGTLTAGATSSAAQVQGAPVANGAPNQIIVFPFATSTADVTLNQGLGALLWSNYEGQNQSADQAQLAQSTAQNICSEVATILSSKGWNAVCQPRGTPVTGNNTLIIDGVFTDISQGNRLQRMAIGLGVGASVVDTQVGVYQYSNGASSELVTFNTHADSGICQEWESLDPLAQPPVVHAGVGFHCSSRKNGNRMPRVRNTRRLRMRWRIPIWNSSCTDRITTCW